MKRSVSAYGPPATIARRIIEKPAAREVIAHVPGESFRWLEHDYPSEIARWNHHPEYEIHLIRRSKGTYIIGDRIGEFGPGHVAIIGPDLAHDWMSDLTPDEVIENRDAVIQFDQDWVDGCVAAIPELGDAKRVLDAARGGIIVSGATAVAVAAELEAVGRETGSQRITHLFALLALLVGAPLEEMDYLASDLVGDRVDREGKTAVDAGLSYILENLTRRVKMSEAARLAHMSEPTFSKYFKKASGLTFSDMVKRLRITNACRLLRHTDASVSSICIAVGYSNLANFNRQFLAETGVTPRAYRALDDNEVPQRKPVSLGIKSADVRRHSAEYPVSALG